MTPLEDDRLRLGRGRAEQVADVLRHRIVDGYFLPGTRLAEEEITAALGVSRNTLREAFRLLSHERLLTHQLNRGVFVRLLSVAEVIDLYRVRRLVEVSAIRDITTVPSGLLAVADALHDGQRALDADDWRGLGSANMEFHRALVALAASPRLDELVRGVFAEQRLVFRVMDDQQRFHEPYLARNRQLHALLADGRGAEAADALHGYLLDAERQIVAGYEPAVARVRAELGSTVPVGSG